MRYAFDSNCQSGNTKPLSLRRSSMAPMAAASFIARQFPRNCYCEGIVRRIDELLFPSDTSLIRAAELQDINLVKRIASLDRDSIDQNIQDFEYNKALAHLLIQGDESFAKALVCEFPNTRVTSAINVAAKRGMTNFLRWLFLKGTPACWGGNELISATQKGRCDTMRWLHLNIPTPRQHRLLGIAAGRLGPIDVRWIMNARGEQPRAEDLQAAADAGRLENILLLSSSFDQLPRISAIGAAAKGHLRVLQWLNDNGGVFTAETMDMAAQSGKINVVKWFHSNRSEGCTARAIDIAADDGFDDIVIFLIRIDAPCSRRALQIAISRGHDTIAKWLHFNCNINWKGMLVDEAVITLSIKIIKWVNIAYPFRGSFDAMDMAAAYNEKEIFIWLHMHRKDGCTSAAMDSFAEHGNLEMVRYIHDQDLSQCTTEAFDLAAGKGHLLVAQWLHENRTEGFTKKAMDLAAAGGHLEVLKWLHSIGESCTTDAMDKAATQGHLEVLRWLHGIGAACTTNAMDDAAARGRLNVLKWLHGIGAPCTTNAMDKAAAGGFVRVIKFLFIFRDEGCSANASISAAQLGYLHILLWIGSHFPSQIDISAVQTAAPTYGWSEAIVRQICNNENC